MNSITENTSLKEQMLAEFQAWESGQSDGTQNWLQRIRKEAIRQFDRLGFPSTRHEEWKYSNVGPLTRLTYDFQRDTGTTALDLESLLIPELDANVVVFVNGVYQPSLSRLVSASEELHIENLQEAYQRVPALFEAHFTQSAGFEKDAFTALNTAFAGQGAFIRVPVGKVIEKPVVLYFISDARVSNVASQPRNLFIAEKNSQVKIVEVYQTIGDQASFSNQVTEISVDTGAYVEYYKVQNESNGAFHIGTTQVNQQSNSHFYAATFTINGGFTRNNLNIVLDGEHCEANLFGLYIPDAKQHVDNHTIVDHAKPRSYSNELYKGILKERGTGVFNGKIFVRPDAQKTNAFQSNRNMILSNDASMNTKPQLEIFADDVKCSHGTTTGQMDEDALFYLRARGIGEDQAKALLMVAFAGDVLTQVKIPALFQYLQNRVAEKLEKS
jgi:Fe-S cluster assembly protein SufD